MPVTFDPKPYIDGLPYDPEQDANEKRDLRKKYRQLEKLTGEHQRPQDHDTEALVVQVAQADELFSKVKNPTEATLDSSVLRNLSGISAQKARAMKLGSTAFDLDDFVTKLITFMGGSQFLEDNEDGSEIQVEEDRGLDWDKIGRKALAKSRRVPVTGYMLGPLSIEPKKRIQVKRQKQEKGQEEERRPQEIKEEDIKRSDNETTKNVLVIKNILESTGPINLFEFIVNPNDFAQSVENLFYVSFLIRDGECAFEITDEGEPKIMLCEQPTFEDRMQGVQRQQIVMEFDMATWQRAIEVWNITTSTIPQRPPARIQLGGKWYG
ncbi:Nse4 C-terminal-domain-containing protein [Scleroderma yunnanense]